MKQVNSKLNFSFLISHFSYLNSHLSILNSQLSTQNCSGQTLISLILIAVIGITVAMGATSLVFVNSRSGLGVQQGSMAYAIAQSGADNAMLRLLRDPSYQGESNFVIDGGYADIQVSSNSGSFIATSSGKIGNYIRKIEIRAHYDENYVLVIDSRKEIF